MPGFPRCLLAVIPAEALLPLVGECAGLGVLVCEAFVLEERDGCVADGTWAGEG